MKKQFLAGAFSLCALGGLSGCATSSVSSTQQASVSKATIMQDPDGQLLQYADPFIGTGGHGHTFPGAVVPFGMVQLSPDNPSKGWTGHPVITIVTTSYLVLAIRIYLVLVSVTCLMC